jgi:hypothetical protein
MGEINRYFYLIKKTKIIDAFVINILEEKTILLRKIQFYLLREETTFTSENLVLLQTEVNKLDSLLDKLQKAQNRMLRILQTEY